MGVAGPEGFERKEYIAVEVHSFRSNAILMPIRNWLYLITCDFQLTAEPSVDLRSSFLSRD
jgi:hypothetical protein